MSNAEQFEYWNGDAGRHWAQEDATMATLLRPVSAALMDHAGIQHCESAIDVGCGGGSQSIMLAERLGPGARVLGVDISEPMLQVAREKLSEPADNLAAIEFLQADAAAHDFGSNQFDLVFSRFGVMFFDDPVAAFSNLRGALRPGARLAFCCWQGMMDNDWARIPIQAALQHVAPPEKPEPNAPGPFAFADTERVGGILQDSGFVDVAFEGFTPTMTMGRAPTLRESVREMAMLGPVSRLVNGQEPQVLEKVFDALEEALAPHYQDGAVALPGAVWFVTAGVD